MSRVLVTGGTGALGREIVPRLASAGHEVVVLSRRASPPVPAGIATVQGDLTTGNGLPAAVAGAEVIVHCASGAGDSAVRGLTYAYTRKTDVDATERLLDVAKDRGAPHVVYISIVGVDRIPLGYYRAKRDTERVIEESGLPYTILRTTQWHTLAWEFGRRAIRGPVVIAPKGFRSQLLDPGEVADRMVEIVERGPAVRAPDMSGPETLTAVDILRSFVEACGKRRPVVEMPVPGKAMKGFAAGYNLVDGPGDGRITWREWLSRNVSAT